MSHPLRSLIVERLAHVPLDDSTRADLLRFVDGEAAEVACARQLAQVFVLLDGVFGPDAATATPFQAAWTLMYAAISRLDALQDGDPVRWQLPVLGGAAPQYNFVFAIYVLAEALLDTLSPDLPAARIVKLRRLWSDSMLRMAAGQQQDLAAGDGGSAGGSLERYQQIAQAKTGSSFALAFGGCGLLLTDDEPLTAALAAIGEVYGTLIQYSDDLLDAATQPNSAPTLPAALRGLPQAGEIAPARLAAALWPIIHEMYRLRALALADGHPELKEGVAALFDAVFSARP